MYAFFKEFSDKLSNYKTIRVLASLLMICLLITVIIYNTPIWAPFAQTIVTAITPFIFGFIIAYVLSPLVDFIAKKGVKRMIAIVIIIIIFIALAALILIVILPVLFENTQLLVTVFIDAFKDINAYISHQEDQNNIMVSIAKEILAQLNSANFTAKLSNIAANSTTYIFSITKSLISGVITTIFAVVISIYVLAQKDKIKMAAYKVFNKIGPTVPEYATQINKQMRIYVRAVGLVMLSKAPAYLTFYYLIGHKNWLMLGILMIFTVLIPYLGPLIVNSIALITAIPQGSSVLFLTCFVVTYSMFVDTYLIDPKIYGHAVKLEPLAVIFTIFLGGSMFGILGILLAIPVLLIIRVTLNTRQTIHLGQQQ